MSRDIVPGIFNSDDITFLYKYKLLEPLSKCCSDQLFGYFKQYMEDNPDDEYTGYLKECFKDKLSYDNYIGSEETQSAVDELKDLTYSSIHANLTIDKLKHYLDLIKMLDDTEMAKPYTQAINVNGVKAIIQNIHAVYKNTGDQTAKELEIKLDMYKDLFKDRRGATAKGTIFKVPARNIQQYRIIQRGIEFLIAQKEAGHIPEEWRHF